MSRFPVSLSNFLFEHTKLKWFLLYDQFWVWLVFTVLQCMCLWTCVHLAWYCVIDFIIVAIVLSLLWWRDTPLITPYLQDADDGRVRRVKFRHRNLLYSVIITLSSDFAYKKRAINGQNISYAGKRSFSGYTYGSLLKLFLIILLDSITSQWDFSHSYSKIPLIQHSLQYALPTIVTWF